MESAHPSKLVGSKILRPREQVEKQLKAAVLSGALRPGERLPRETELAEQFGVSRATVREALRSLATQDLIETTPGAGGGSFVRAVDDSSLRSALSNSVTNLLALGTIAFEEVALVRQHLEVPAVRLAAEHRDENDLAELAGILETQKTISIHDPQVPSLDEDFHATIARASGNRVLASFVSALHRQTEPVLYLDLSPEVGRTTVRQHQQILAAIRDQNPATAEACMIEHLTYLREHLVAYHARP